MELVTNEIFNLKLDTEKDSYIQKFSKLNIDNLNLEPEKKILLGFLFFKTELVPIHNFNKQYYLVVTKYFTENKYKMIYPLHINLDLVPEKNVNNIEKILKKKYEFTKSEIQKSKIYQLYSLGNIYIYGVNIPKTFKKIKEMKMTRVIHTYTDPHNNDKIEDIYPQVVSSKLSSLNKRFFFFYNDIKISLKEKKILEMIN